MSHDADTCEDGCCWCEDALRTQLRTVEAERDRLRAVLDVAFDKLVEMEDGARHSSEHLHRALRAALRETDPDAQSGSEPATCVLCGQLAAEHRAPIAQTQACHVAPPPPVKP